MRHAWIATFLSFSSFTWAGQLDCTLNLGFEGELIAKAEYSPTLSLNEPGNQISLSIPEEDPQIEVTIQSVDLEKIKVKVTDLESQNVSDEIQFQLKPILYITTLPGAYTFGLGDEKRPFNQLSMDCMTQ